MGVFMPWINYKGAFVGTVCGWIFAAWLGIVSIVVEPLEGTRDKLPLSVENCSSPHTETTSSEFNFSTPYVYSGDKEEHTFFQSTSLPVSADQRPLIYDTLYSLSPFTFVTCGFLASIAVGTLVSLLTGFSKPSKASPELFVPILDNKILPEKIRKFFRFGVPDISPVEETKQSLPEEQNGDVVSEDNLFLPAVNEEAPKIV